MKVCLCFSFFMSSVADAMLTQFLIRSGVASEANPIMAFAMTQSPLGMFFLKGVMMVVLLAFWRKCSAEFFAALSLGMSSITCWNSILLCLAN